MRRPHQVCGREVCFRLREAFQLARLVIKCQVVKAAGYPDAVRQTHEIALRLITLGMLMFS